MMKTGVGALVVAVGYLAEKFLFASDKVSGFNDKIDDFKDKADKAAKAQERLNKALGVQLPTSLDEVQGALDTEDYNIWMAEDVILKKTREFVKKWKNILGEGTTEMWEEKLAKNNDGLAKVYQDEHALLVEQGEESERLIKEFENKKTRIRGREGDLRKEKRLKEFNDEKDAETTKYNIAIANAQNRYLKDLDSKEVFDNKKEQLEISHLRRLKKILSKYNEDTSGITKEILDLKIKGHESEADSFKKQQDKIHKQRDKDLLAEHKRNIAFINDKTKTEKEQEENAKVHADEIIKIQTDAFNDEIEQAGLFNEDKTQIEQDFVDFQLKNIGDVAAAQKLAKEKELEDQKETSRQKLEVMKAASDAIFTIMAQNANRALDQERKRLEEQKESGVISQEEYEEEVEKVQRKAFAQKKKRDSMEVIMNTAMAVAKVFAQTGVFGFAAMAPIIAVGAAQLAVIQNQKYALGGMIEEFANGGMVNGKSHAQGGEKFAVGGRVVELEGGEAVINKRSTAMFRGQLSAMNAAGGGVRFADGGLLNQPSFSQQQFNALGQNQMMGAMGSSSKVVVVEADITDSQNSVSVIQSEATI